MKNLYISFFIGFVLTMVTSVSNAQSTTYTQNFDNGTAADWQTSGGLWRFEEGQYHHMYSNGIFLSIYNGSGFAEFTYSATIKPDWDNNYGMVFNYNDNRNYYRIELDADPQKAYLVEMKDSIETVIYEKPYADGGKGIASTIKVTNYGLTTTVEINGKMIFDKFATTSFTSGKIGLYAWWQPVWFDNVEVVAAKTTAISAVSKKAEELSVYPNPLSKGLVTIRFAGEAKNATLEIFSNDGNLVFAQSGMSTNEVKVDATCLKSKGLYFVRINTAGKTYFSKLTKN